jgi:hypothetical protein
MAPTANLRSVVTPDAVVLDITRNVMVPLNSMGGYIWRKLQDGSLVDEIVREVVRETGADMVTVQSDIRTFIEQLAAMHLITTTPL